mgnify:CR=1 FL=1
MASRLRGSKMLELVLIAGDEPRNTIEAEEGGRKPTPLQPSSYIASALRTRTPSLCAVVSRAKLDARFLPRRCRRAVWRHGIDQASDSWSIRENCAPLVAQISVVSYLSTANTSARHVGAR